MSVLQAIILGLIQGLTEFLPISSSGHLVIAENLLGLRDQTVLFIVLIHVATLVAVMVYFWREILRVRLTDILWVIMGTIPAVVVGFLFKDFLESLFTSVNLVGLALMVTGIVNILTDRKLKKVESHRIEAKKSTPVLPLTWRQAVGVGIAQAIAITPGISRSGSTVAAGVWQGLPREIAFRFSFFLAMPAILGALVLELKDFGLSQLAGLFSPIYLVGMLFAFVGGMLSLKLFDLVLKKAKLNWFGYYAFGVGLLAFLVSIWV